MGTVKVILAALAYFVAAACFVVFVVATAKSFYHQWAKKGTYPGLFGNTFLGIAAMAMALGAVWVADHLSPFPM